MPPFSCTSSFIAPTRPAPGSVWPAMAFMLLKASGASHSSRCAKSTFETAVASMGSPSEVPVPWASKVVMSLGVSCASAIDALSTPTCARPFGAVRLALRPSCRTALPWRSM
eukprot:3680599-Prymnesium_polylepis.1